MVMWHCDHLIESSASFLMHPRSSVYHKWLLSYGQKCVFWCFGDLDLDLWPFASKIESTHLWTISSLDMKFGDDQSRIVAGREVTYKQTNKQTNKWKRSESDTWRNRNENELLLPFCWYEDHSDRSTHTWVTIIWKWQYFATLVKTNNNVYSTLTKWLITLLWQ